MSGAITSDTPEAFVETLRDVNDNHAKDDIESALDYISDAKCEFVKELKYQFSNLEYLEPEIIDFCPRYDVCIKNYVYETCKRLLDKFVEIGNCHRAHVSRDERFAFEITENQC